MRCFVRSFCPPRVVREVMFMVAFNDLIISWRKKQTEKSSKKYIFKNLYHVFNLWISQFSVFLMRHKCKIVSQLQETTVALKHTCSISQFCADNVKTFNGCLITHTVLGLCLVLSLLPGWMQWFSSLAWRMRSAFRQSTITSCAYPATETQLRCQWSSLEHKVFVVYLSWIHTHFT